jgi:vesicle coat complex subunit
MFFVKYNSPYYVKIEELNILTELMDKSNAYLMLDELGKYCNFVDVYFIRKLILDLGKLQFKFHHLPKK